MIEAEADALAAPPDPGEPLCRYVRPAEVWHLVVHLCRIVLRACDRYDGCGAAIRVLAPEAARCDSQRVVAVEGVACGCRKLGRGR